MHQALNDDLFEDGEERAAALTYVAGRLDRVGFLLVVLFVAEGARRVAT
jgi:hypothetical protein